MIRFTALALGLIATPHAFAQDHDMGGDHSCEPNPQPIMQMGDFNGNGVIDSGDIEMISAYVDAGDYAAFFDMNVDGVLNGTDVSAVATHMGQAGTARDAQMAELFATTEPYRNIYAAYGAGYAPLTPDLKGHGIHFANMDLVYSWGSRGFQPGVPEGLNYAADGRLIAAFYYAPGAVDLYDYGYPVPADTVFQTLAVPASFDGLMAHQWHNHVGACFGADTCPVDQFDQCMAEDMCYDLGGQLWSPKFHMLHVWLFELNECGPFAGVDMDISHMAPEEPNHMVCNTADVVPVAYNVDGSVMAPMGFEMDECYTGGHSH